jgi:CRP/FNR family transcriptional regulator
MAMRSPYGLKIIESCLVCPIRRERLFCDLPDDALHALDGITTPTTYPKGAVLFVEGQSPRGVFAICSGRAKLSASSADGKTIILRIAGPGEVVGLPAAISGEPYELAAEILEPTQVNFIPRDAFLRFLTEYGQVSLRVAQLLANTCHQTYKEVRSVGLSRSSSQKLARFLLDWSVRRPLVASNGGVALTLTHEEIAQTIGTARETVTRLLTELRSRRLIQLKGTSLIISDRKALELLASSAAKR